MDGEYSQALSTCFTKAIHLRCFRHIEGNVRWKLSQLHVTDFRQYLSEVFGKQEGRTYQPGLLDATARDEFDAILLSLKQPWAEREGRGDGNSKVPRLDDGEGLHDEELYGCRRANKGGPWFSSR